MTKAGSAPHVIWINKMRKQYIVDRNFQGKFILTFVAICLGGMVLAIGLFNWLALSAIEALKWRMVLYESSLSEVIFPHLLYLGIFALVFTASSTALVSWVITWKVAGPIYRLKKDIDGLGNGNLSIRFALRKTDSFKDVALELDSAASALRERFGRINSDFREVKKVVDSLPDSKEELLALKAERLSHTLEALEKSVRG